MNFSNHPSQKFIKFKKVDSALLFGNIFAQITAQPQNVIFFKKLDLKDKIH